MIGEGSKKYRFDFYKKIWYNKMGRCYTDRETWLPQFYASLLAMITIKKMNYRPRFFWGEYTRGSGEPGGCNKNDQS
jgi:hypothetical protein